MSRLEAEIKEQPETLARQLSQDLSEAVALLCQDQVTHIVLAARGSSDNAARFAQYLISEHLGIPTYLATPSLFTRGVPPRLRGALVIGISQSGQGPDVNAVLQSARDQHLPTLAVTNNSQSPLGQLADVVIDIEAGPEQSVAATKSFTGTLFAFAHLVASAGAPNFLAQVEQLPALMAATLDEALNASVLLDLPAQLTGLTAIGRGTSMSIAEESALKLREVGLIRAEAYSAADLVHGHIAANSAGSAALVFCSPTWPVEYWQAVIDRLRGVGVRTTAITKNQLSADVVHLVDAPQPWQCDVISTIWGQIAAMRLGESKGLDLDNPPGLSKVTQTR